MAAPNDNDTTKDRSVPEDTLTKGAAIAPEGSVAPKEADGQQQPVASDEGEQEELRADQAIAEEAEARYRASGIADTVPYEKYRAGRID